MEWIAVLCAVVAVAAFGGCVVLSGRVLAWRSVVRKRVLVAIDEDRSIEGVLWSQRGELLVLRSAVFHKAGERIEMAGEVVLERPGVMWVQVLS